MARLWRERHVKRHDVGPRERSAQVVAPTNRLDLHSEAVLGDPRDGVPDASSPHDQQRLAVQLDAEQEARPPAAEVTLADYAVALDDPARDREDEGDSVLGDGLGEDVRCVAYLDIKRCCGSKIHIVMTDREVRDDAQLRAGLLEHLRVDAVDQEREDCVGPRHERLELGRLVRRPPRARSRRHIRVRGACRPRGRHRMRDDDAHPRTVTNFNP